jgi:Carboxypeptidase regulatory-like domain
LLLRPPIGEMSPFISGSHTVVRFWWQILDCPRDTSYMLKLPIRVLTCFLLVLCPLVNYAQSVTGSGEIRGTVIDPSNAAVPGVTVEITNPVSNYTRSITTDSQGRFTAANVPLNNYHVTATAPGLQRTAQDVDVRSPVPLDLKISLQLGSQASTVTVEVGSDLVGLHCEVSKQGFGRVRSRTAHCSQSVPRTSVSRRSDPDGGALVSSISVGL